MMDGGSRRWAGHAATRRRIRPAFCRGTVTTAALGLGLLLAGCIPSDRAQEVPESVVQDRDERVSESLGERRVECVRPAGAFVQDIDPEDSPVSPWQKPEGEELVVEFETGPLSGRYASLVELAAGIWSESPCVNAVAVEACSSGANCVTVEEDGGPSRNTDGEMSWDGGRFMEGAAVTLYTQPLDRATDNGALATVVHEMGHALGLDHRLDRSDVMNAVTNNGTDPIPDAVDFANLAAIYGSAPGASRP